MFIESLELRSLLTATLGADGLLTVTGTDTRNEIRIGLDRDGKLVVGELTRPAVPPPPGTPLPQPTITRFTAADVHSILVNAGGGHDLVEMGRRLDIDAVINGGEGNDQLIAGAGDDHVNGGPGHDQILGGRGADALNGDAGNDRINAVDGGGVDSVDGGTHLAPTATRPGGDVALVDLVDVVVNVEHVRIVTPPTRPGLVESLALFDDAARVA
jgi:Ca2+-binding RTX toxin-like protein